MYFDIIEILKFFITTGAPILVIVIIIWILSTPKGNDLPSQAKSDNHLWQMKLTGGNSFIVTILFLSLIALFERVLFDLSRNMVTTQTDYLESMFNNLDTIIFHALVIIPILIVCIAAYVLLGEKKNTYGVVFIPYLLTSIVLTVQLVSQISFFFSYHHTQIQFYIVMALLAVILSSAIFFVQKRYNLRVQATNSPTS